jgi:anti-sigma B factor antagonist
MSAQGRRKSGINAGQSTQPAALSAPTLLALDGELTIYRATVLHQTLVAALAAAPNGLAIELAGVTEIDSAGVQLLMAGKRAANGSGRPFTLTEHSAPVLEVFELLDLAAFFGDPLVVNA